MSKIDVLFVGCGLKPEVMTIINDLQSYQELVDGWIQTVYCYKRKYVLVCNEEGMMLHLPPNARLDYQDGEYWTTIYGDFFIASLIETEDGEDFGSIDEEDIPYMLEHIHLIGKRY